MQKKIAEYIKKFRLIKPNSKLIIALSGGADSVVLTHILHKMGYNCIAAHCNFELRDAESDRDELFVRQLCNVLNIPLEIIHFNTNEYAAKQKVSIEMAARKLRYNWFENIRIKYDADFKNSQTNGTSVSVPTFLSNKWSNADAEHDVPAAKQYRSGNMSVAQFQAHWLASWVEEFGIDGFRSDTAKHVTKSTWKLLKQYCQEGLEKWRSNTSVSEDPAAAWTDNFWMTGEHWGYKTDPSDDA